MFLFRKERRSWVEDLYFACQRLGKIAKPTSGDLSAFDRFSHTTDASFPLNVSMILY